MGRILAIIGRLIFSLIFISFIIIYQKLHYLFTPRKHLTDCFSIYIYQPLAICVIFYAWFGVILFYGTEQGKEGFQNLIEAIWWVQNIYKFNERIQNMIHVILKIAPFFANKFWFSSYERTLFICITTANYPDVMMPSYNESRFVPALYFVSFMSISFFYLMNLILAIAVDS